MSDKKLKLPKEIMIVDNPDKSHHEKWTEGRDELDIPTPFQCIISGKTNFGKTTIIHNLIMRQTPEFKRILIVHCGGESSEEYSVLGKKMSDLNDFENGNWYFLDKIPDPSEFRKNACKTLLIFEDLNFEGMHKKDKEKIDRLFGYASTHSPMGLSIVLTAQNFYSIPPTIRRMAKLIILGKTLDKRSSDSIANKVGIALPTFRNLMNLLEDSHDSLWLDETSMSPYPLRMNGYIHINIADY